MQFVYKATTKDGKIVQGIVEANDLKQAAANLRNREFFPIRIGVKEQQTIEKYLPFLGGVKPSDLLLFTQQLSSMLTAGLTLMQALSILKNQTQKESMLRVIEGIMVDIEDGKPFSTAITRFPKVFSPIYVSLIRAAETSGILDKILLRLSSNLEKEQKLKGVVKSALMYPAIVVIGMVLVVTVMMIFVIPQLASLYQNLNIELPLPTQIIIGLSNFLTTFWPLVIFLVFLGIYLFKRWYSGIAGKLIVDSLMLKIPVFGNLNKQYILTEFTRTFGLLIASGTLVVDAFRQTADITGNILFKNAINDISERVEKGVSVGDAMLAYPLFPPILVEMVKIGEQTGKLDEALLKNSEYFEREVDLSVKNLTTALEPIIMVVLGAGVAFLIISIITPIYSLTSQIQ